MMSKAYSSTAYLRWLDNYAVASCNRRRNFFDRDKKRVVERLGCTAGEQRDSTGYMYLEIFAHCYLCYHAQRDSIDIVEKATLGRGDVVLPCPEEGSIIVSS